ncbi:MAG: transcriptional repressor [Pseudomonadota bacterium]
MPRPRGKVQESVLKVLRQHDQPQSAYALLDHMRQDNPRIAPTSVYRALEALTKTGEVHRLESLRAFVARRNSSQEDDCIMAICDHCGTVEEHAAQRVIEDLCGEAAKSGFKPTRHVIEMHGQCASCEPDGDER